MLQYNYNIWFCTNDEGGKRMKRLIISIVLSICMVFSIFPLSALGETVESAEESMIIQESENNNVETEVEDWEYEPVIDTSGKTTAGLLTMADSDDDSISVTVKATEKSGNTVAMSGARVNLYVGTTLKKYATTNSSGIAKLDLSDLTLEEKLKATISAEKTIKQGKAVDGTGRDTLFRNFPKDSDNNYIRYSYQLHSEKIDSNGNWIGEKIPVTLEKNKVDIAFVIDATGSMAGEINSVKNNVTSFSETLVNNGLDVRFSIIEYRDITCSEPTILHTYNGSNWYSTSQGVIDVLSDISATGGGDTPETTVDALGMAASSSMKWRSGAAKFAFVLTDAGYKTNNNYGYSNMEDLISELCKQKIATSVITTSGYKSTYSSLYERTGGIYASISSSTFATEMQKLAESVVTTAAGDMELTLSEPRMLYNISVCYLANDDTSRSRDYYNSVKNMLNSYAQDVAKTSDGHVLINKVILFSTDNRLNFYDTGNMASMADIHIETKEKDDGTWLNNLQIHSNAYVDGFYSSDTVQSDESIGMFDHLKDRDSYLNRNTFMRIQMSAIEGAGWNNSFIDDREQYASTVLHESGHYIFGFFDEYMDQNGTNWTGTTRPGGMYGLMDNQHEDIEMSKTNIDYSYFGGTIPSGSDSRHTRHSFEYTNSCEGQLGTFLLNGQTKFSNAANLDLGNYQATYTYTSGSNDRTAEYSYSGLSSDDYISVTGTGVNTLAAGDDALSSTYFDTIPEEKNTFGDIVYTGNADKVSCTFNPADEADYFLYIRKQGETSFTKTAFNKNDGSYAADLNLDYGEMAEVYLVRADGSKETCKYYTLDRSGKTDVGYIFTTFNRSITGYVSNTAENSYVIVDDRSSYVNGDYISVNDAVIISEETTNAITGGEIYSVASKNAVINYDSVSWFKYADGAWTQLPSSVSQEENDNIGVLADTSGAGLYVLMAKKPSEEPAASVSNLTYTQKETSDSLITLHFDDSNGNTKFYNVYYSNKDFTDVTGENIIKRVFPADSTDIEMNLYDRDRTVYLAVEAVLSDGRHSGLQKIVITTEAADSDGDGLPDWYNDQYGLWPEEGKEKDIAGSDDDGDTLTNLEEYHGGSDPTNPNDPVHTTAIPVQKIKVDKTSVKLEKGGTANIGVTVQPANATNKKVIWSIDDESIAGISKKSDKQCTVKGLAIGSTKLRAVTSDGGYVATCTITVEKATPVIKAPNISKTVSKKKQKFRINATVSPAAKLTYSSNNKAIAVDQTGTVTVKAKYIGGAVITISSAETATSKAAVKKVSVKVNPAKTKLLSVKKKGSKIVVKWKAAANVSGYQICYSVSKKFKSGNKTVFVKGKKKKAYTSKALKKKKYFVRVRTYKVVSGKKYYSSWSNVKSVKVK